MMLPSLISASSSSGTLVAPDNIIMKNNKEDVTSTSTSTTTTNDSPNDDNSTANHQDDENNSDDNNNNNPILPTLLTVRFYWVRHGETISNYQNVVVGQSDSPLTEVGKNQAKLLGRSTLIRETVFWKKYCSDLGRAKETASYITSSPEDQEPNSIDTIITTSLRQQPPSGWIFDNRIREIAKGVRQEYPKSWGYEQALEDRLRLGKDIPKSETSEEAWKRIEDFISHVIEEALLLLDDDEIDETERNINNNQERDKPDHEIDNDDDDDNNDVIDDDEEAKRRRIVNVLVVTHAGTLRLLLKKMVPYADPSLNHDDDPYSPSDDSKRLAVPNTSVTIMDVTPRKAFISAFMKRRRRRRTATDGKDDDNKDDDNDDDTKDTTNGDNVAAALSDDDDDGTRHYNIETEEYTQILWSTRVVEYMWTDHITHLGRTINDV